ncbi:MAG: hypothetical protein HYW48_02910 [Deltaproteobacteria bacterium]|nr:hypothetical protein [Deltaproteobacteria bacterium]
MNEIESKQISIINRSRILRVLRRVCKANLSILIRPLSGGNKKVLGKAVGLYITEERSRFTIMGILVYGVSDRGMAYLKDVSYVGVQIMVSNVGLNFECVIKDSGDHSLLLSLPEQVATFDRRKNERFEVCSPLKSFVVLGADLPSDVMLAPATVPMFEEFKDLAEIHNISKGGLCTRTFFPAYYACLKPGYIASGAILYLPLEIPQTMKMILRWTRVIKEKEEEDAPPEDAKRVYLFGWEFMELSQKTLLSLKTYLKKLVEVDSF